MKLSHILEGKQHIAIAGHVHPDGDCIGSTLGLYHALQSFIPDADIRLYLENVPHEYRFLNGVENYRDTVEEAPVPDVFFALDCGEFSRIGVARDLFAQSSCKVVIDHHISNRGFGDYDLIEPDASSTSELIYLLLQENAITITAEIAECLYMGIVQDTGVFQYSCTSKRTMEVAGALMEKGIAYSDIIERSFFQKSFVQNRIMGKALVNAELILDGKMIYSVISTEELQEMGAALCDLDGIVSQLRNTEGVEVSAFFYETGNGDVKVSLRSKKEVDVSKIASDLGGGGHIRAAAFLAKNTKPEKIIPVLIKKVSSQL